MLVKHMFRLVTVDIFSEIPVVTVLHCTKCTLIMGSVCNKNVTNTNVILLFELEYHLLCRDSASDLDTSAVYVKKRPLIWTRQLCPSVGSIFGGTALQQPTQMRCEANPNIRGFSLIRAQAGLG
jgi:hypothetical protein